ncbi:DUF6059 family protein [Streptomyces atratus]|uniref:DUF6059 family protein n=1 Tax=Streptomyces atratus TaxID=1893 RepID=UPI0022594656|nr:DUF6059 family protein [Streptomyces atratus]MCX5339141.1 hypothetical protein [Streptomyces atratus]
MLRPLKAVAIACWGNAVAYGKMWLAVPEIFEPEPTGVDPGALHPEKVRHDVPLSRVEKALERQLRDLV